MCFSYSHTVFYVDAQGLNMCSTFFHVRMVNMAAYLNQACKQAAPEGICLLLNLAAVAEYWITLIGFPLRSNLLGPEETRRAGFLLLIIHIYLSGTSDHFSNHDIKIKLYLWKLPTAALLRSSPDGPQVKAEGSRVNRILIVYILYLNLLFLVCWSKMTKIGSASKYLWA